MSLDALPFNAFDLVLVIVLLAGISHGRRTGMSVELPSLLQWLLVLFLCAMAYEPAGQYLNQSTGIFSTLSCYLMAYVGIALVVVLLFAAIKKSMGGKLLGSDVFGRAEYYLGMGSGVLRFSCILLAGLAILNARAYTSTEVKAMEKFQDDVYGSNFFPTWHTFQATVFEKSLTGPWIKENLAFLLIKPTAPEQKELHQKEATWR